MRVVLLLIVLAAIGFSAVRALKTGVPTVPGAGAPPAAEPHTPAQAVRRFEQDVNDLVQDAAADRSRQLEEATR